MDNSAKEFFYDDSFKDYQIPPHMTYDQECVIRGRVIPVFDVVGDPGYPNREINNGVFRIQVGDLPPFVDDAVVVRALRKYREAVIVERGALQINIRPDQVIEEVWYPIINNIDLTWSHKL